MFELKQKVVAITGAGSGIGLALTRQCLAAGARVAAADIDTVALSSLSDAHADNLLLSTVDVRDREAMTRWAAETVERFGHCDVIVNNAGVSLSSRAQDMRREDLEWVFDINFWGVINGVEAFLPGLMARPEACIVNISSLFGLMAVPSQSAYNASKFAVRGYSEALRQDLRDTTVKVVTVHPGGVKTNIVRNGKHFHSIDGSETSTEDQAATFERIASTTPERAAARIIHGIRRGKARVLIGRDAILLDLIQRLLPGLYDRLLLPLSTRGRRAIADT